MEGGREGEKEGEGGKEGERGREGRKERGISEKYSKVSVCALYVSNNPIDHTCIHTHLLPADSTDKIYRLFLICLTAAVLLLEVV